MAGQTFPANPDIGVIWRFTQDSTGLTNYVDYDGTALTAAKVGDIVFWEGTQWRRVGLGGHFETVVRAIALTGGFSALLRQSSAGRMPAVPAPSGGALLAAGLNIKSVLNASSITINVKEGDKVLLWLSHASSAVVRRRVRRGALGGPVVGGESFYLSLGTSGAAPVCVLDESPGSGEITYHFTSHADDRAQTVANVMAAGIAKPVSDSPLATAKDLEDMQASLDGLEDMQTSISALLEMLQTTGSTHAKMVHPYEDNGKWKLLFAGPLPKATDRIAAFFARRLESLEWDLGVSDDDTGDGISAFGFNFAMEDQHDFPVRAAAGKYLWVRIRRKQDPLAEPVAAPNMRLSLNTHVPAAGSELRCSVEGAGDPPEYTSLSYSWYFDTPYTTEFELISRHSTYRNTFSGYDTDTLSIPDQGFVRGQLRCRVQQGRSGHNAIVRTVTTEEGFLSSRRPLRSAFVITS